MDEFIDAWSHGADHTAVAPLAGVDTTEKLRLLDKRIGQLEDEGTDGERLPRLRRVRADLEAVLAYQGWEIRGLP